jgi:hypothetical protein
MHLMIGRGTRRHDDKTVLLVIDIADNSRMHRLSGLNDLFNLPTYRFAIEQHLNGRDVEPRLPAGFISRSASSPIRLA